MFSSDTTGWETGVVFAEGQNLARRLMEAPSNHVTPTAFANIIEEEISALSQKVTIHKGFDFVCFSGSKLKLVHVF